LAEQGRAGEALPTLAAVYQTYTEGFETRELQDARKLLDRLAPPSQRRPYPPSFSPEIFFSRRSTRRRGLRLLRDGAWSGGCRRGAGRGGARRSGGRGGRSPGG